MVKRSIEQSLRIKNFEAINGNYERNAVVKNQGTKQRVQRILGDCRSRNSEARHGRIESGASVKNQREQRRVQRGPRECWRWKANGLCSEGDMCSFRRDKNKRAKYAPPPAPPPEPSTPQEVRNPARAKSPRGRSPSGRMSRLPWKEHLKGTCTNPSCEKWNSPQCLFYKTEKGCNFGEKCSYAHRRDDEQPGTEKPKRMVTTVP